jgi:hypothetical protein
MPRFDPANHASSLTLPAALTDYLFKAVLGARGQLLAQDKRGLKEHQQLASTLLDELLLDAFATGAMPEKVVLAQLVDIPAVRHTAIKLVTPAIVRRDIDLKLATAFGIAAQYNLEHRDRSFHLRSRQIPGEFGTLLVLRSSRHRKLKSSSLPCHVMQIEVAPAQRHEDPILVPIKGDFVKRCPAPHAALARIAFNDPVLSEALAMSTIPSVRTSAFGDDPFQPRGPSEKAIREAGGEVLDALRGDYAYQSKIAPLARLADVVLAAPRTFASPAGEVHSFAGLTVVFDPTTDLDSDDLAAVYLIAAHLNQIATFAQVACGDIAAREAKHHDAHAIHRFSATLEKAALVAAKSDLRTGTAGPASRSLWSLHHLIGLHWRHAAWVATGAGTLPADEIDGEMPSWGKSGFGGEPLEQTLIHLLPRPNGRAGEAQITVPPDISAKRPLPAFVSFAIEGLLLLEQMASLAQAPAITLHPAAGDGECVDIEVTCTCRLDDWVHAQSALEMATTTQGTLGADPTLIAPLFAALFTEKTEILCKVGLPGADGATPHVKTYALPGFGGAVVKVTTPFKTLDGAAVTKAFGEDSIAVGTRPLTVFCRLSNLKFGVSFAK